MYNPCWDMNITMGTFKKVLKNPKDRLFGELFTRLLCHVPFNDVFHKFITPRYFKTHYPKVRRFVDGDLAGAGRIEFWDWLYARLKSRRS